MEVDESELDSTLLQQFSCLGTTDRDVLISQFHKLVGDGANERDAAFYLDMNNWNLQEAVGAYFDLQSASSVAGPPLVPPPSLVLLEDVTVGDGESVPPDTAFTKTWRVKNSGGTAWPAGCSLRLLHGTRLTEQVSLPLPGLPAGQAAVLNMQMRSPLQSGIYSSKWRAVTADDAPFGDVIWVIVTVQQDGVLAVTQQMTRLTELGGSLPPPPPPPASTSPPHLPAFAGINAPGRPAAPPVDDSWPPPTTDAEMD